jgi:hypothetical protein
MYILLFPLDFSVAVFRDLGLEGFTALEIYMLTCAEKVIYFLKSKNPVCPQRMSIFSTLSDNAMPGTVCA